MIIPMNPYGEYSGGSTAGSIIAQKWFADDKGKVIVAFDRWCRFARSSEKPRLGFFYDSIIGKVTHRFSIDDITDNEGIKRAGYVRDFLPPWRRDLFRKELKPGAPCTWCLIKGIYELKHYANLSHFGKRRIRSFVYSNVCSDLPYIKEKASPEKFIEQRIFSCTVSERNKLTELDLELIIWALIVKKQGEYVDRQFRLSRSAKKLRLDMLLRTNKGEHVVLELKKDVAHKETLNQLRSYMNKVRADHRAEIGLKKLKGIIVANKIHPDLDKAIKCLKTENEEISSAEYGFAFTSKELETALFR